MFFYRTYYNNYDGGVDRSGFNTTSAAADHRLDEAKDMVTRFDFSTGNVLLFNPNLHLVEANLSKFRQFIKDQNLFLAKIVASPDQKSNIKPKYSKRVANFIAVSTTSVSSK